MIEPEHPRLSIVRQCELVSISRSGFYHRPAGETPLNLALMRLVDEQFLETLGLPRFCGHGYAAVAAEWNAAAFCSGVM